MSSKSNVAVILVTLFIFSACASRTAYAAPPKDACSLLTTAQVRTILGISVGAGSHLTPTYLKVCTWAPIGGPTKLFSSLTLSLQSADGYEASKSVAQQMKTVMKEKGAGQIASGSVGGIGDDAYYTSMGSGYTGLIIKKGNVALKVAIYGHLATEKKEAMEKTLALDVLAKM